MADDSETNIVADQDEDAPDTKIARYVAEIELYDRECQKWDRQSKRILRRYKDDRGGDGTIESQQRRFNVLWSNTQNLLPALYARNPKPDIQRRFKDADPVGRVTSDVLERSVSYFCDTDHFAGTSRQCVLDYLLPGRGTLWVRYVPHFKPADELTNTVGPGDDQKELAKAPEVIDYEEVIPDYVHRQDFGHNVARTWDEVWCGWRIVYMDRKELKERFSKLSDAQIAAIPMDYKKRDLDGKEVSDGTEKSVIYELWDKIRKNAVWFHKSIPDALDVRPDPLRLEHFFPFPKPLFTNLINETLIPTPLYVEYQDQAAELDQLTQRIANMTRALKVVGVTDASVEGLNRMFNEGTENELIPIQQWALFAAEKGGMKGAMELFDIKMVAETVTACYQAREQVKRDLDEITGMSDIIRGTTDPDETASAQKLKSGYANQRISDMQRDVQRFIRETIRIMVDVIAGHFQIETIKQISGVRLLTAQEKQAYSQPQPGGPPLSGAAGPQGAGASPPGMSGVVPPLPPNVSSDQMQDMLQAPTWEDVEGLLRNNALRNFRIDIETDSTIKADEQADQAARMEYVKVIGGLIQQAESAPPEMAPFLGTVVAWVSRAFPIGKELEGSLTSMIQKLEKQAANPQPKPDPAMAKVQADAQAEQQKMQSEGQLQQMKIQGDMQLAQQKMQNEVQIEHARLQAKQASDASEAQQAAVTDQHENELEAQREAAKLQQEERLAQLKMDNDARLEIELAHIKAENAIAVARINAKATVGVTEEAEEQARVDKAEGEVRKADLDAAITRLTEATTQPHPQLVGAINNLAQAHSQAAQQNSQTAKAHMDMMQQHSKQMADLHGAITSEKEIVRDPKTGKPTGVRTKPKSKDIAGALRN